MQCVAKDPDFEELFVDSTIVRVHQHAAGAQKKKALKPLADPEEGCDDQESFGRGCLGKSSAIPLDGSRISANPD